MAVDHDKQGSPSLMTSFPKGATAIAEAVRLSGPFLLADKMSKYFDIEQSHERLADLIKLGYRFDDAFSKSGADQIEGAGLFYVYFLVDPRDCSVFYVGKGIRKRVSDHVKHAKIGRVDNSEKHKRIVDVMNSGGDVIEKIIFRTNNEAYALFVEKFFISELREYGITNIANGMATNAEIVIERAEAVRKMIAPIEWLEANPDKDFIKVFGSMAAYHEFSHRMLDEVIAESRMKLKSSHGINT